ncbi:MAG: ArsR family transcriptional regulator [Gammaproteobacteria bacterium]|nr:ArsR family transcriptional regulator [Gammaproteobacteria bacterium]|tara:strand:+ start:1581 stop:2600 length:1020 start_codon:yes stop_codon:yes gene_type:complete
MSATTQSIDINTRLAIGGNTDELARVFKALADPLRLDILRLLRAESFGVLELCRIVDVRQSALSHHLKILAQAGLVSTRREGNSIFYRRALLLSDDTLLSVRQSAFAALDQLPLRRELASGIQQIHDERSEQSLLFFERHAERFLEKQELVAEYAHYRDTLHDLLDGLTLPPQPQVLEVGPGESPLLSELARRFQHLTALDNSMEMLNRARQSLAQRLGKDDTSPQVSFIHGDTRIALTQGLRVDLLIYNMVLHHIPSPRETFQDCAQLLNQHGTLLLIDLSHHDQDWVRESCGDLWLGFTEQDLDAWADEAGLGCGQRVYLGLRNGFQVQMRIFTRTQ